MIAVHERVVDLAAASIDFELSPAERAELDGHLTSCAGCRSLVAAYIADARALSDLPRLALARRRAELVRSLVRSRSVDWAP